MNNIKMAIKEIGCDSDEWIKLAQDSDQSRSLVNMNLFIRWVTISFSRRTVFYGVSLAGFDKFLILESYFVSIYIYQTNHKRWSKIM